MFLIKKDTKAYENINSEYIKPEMIDQEKYIIITDETLKEKIKNNCPFYDLIFDENNQLIDVQVYPNISYSIDNTTITTTEIATITVSDPLPIQVIVDGVDYGVDTDGVIEYQDESVGEHIIELKAEGYKTAVIKIGVIE